MENLTTQRNEITNKPQTLSDPWLETLKKSDLGDLLVDLFDSGLDAITNNVFIQRIPILKSVVTVFKLGNSVRERAHLKKLEVFIYEINSGAVDEKKKEQYLDRMSKNKRAAERELEYILMLLDRMIAEEKAQFLARLYIAYINEDIDWNMFCQLSEIIDRFLHGDTECMNNSILKNSNRSEIENCAIQRLQSMGIVRQNARASVFDASGNPVSTMHDGTYEITGLGDLLKRIILI